MTTRLNPYLSFRDTAREAMDFYHGVFGGQLTQSTFGDFNAAEDPADKDKIMHAQLETPGGLTLMASDTPSSMNHTPGSGYSVSLSGDDETELRRYWERLSADSTVTMPLDRAPWGDLFGMCVDKYGVSWMVSISTAPGAA